MATNVFIDIISIIIIITIIINFIIDNFIIIIAFIIFIASTVTIIDPEPLQASLTGRTRPGSSHNYVALECIPLIDCVCIFDTLSLGGIQFVDISVPRNVHPGKDDDNSDDDDSADDDSDDDDSDDDDSDDDESDEDDSDGVDDDGDGDDCIDIDGDVDDDDLLLHVVMSLTIIIIIIFIHLMCLMLDCSSVENVFCYNVDDLKGEQLSSSYSLPSSSMSSSSSLLLSWCSQDYPCHSSL
jgi:hypothetical protein